MNQRRPSIFIGLTMLLLLALACNLPGAGSVGAETAVAQTVEAELTKGAATAGTATETLAVSETASFTPTSTETPVPTVTNTPLLTFTNTPIPCNQAAFVADVTIPDDSQIVVNSNFTKTWRLQNTGSCTWTSGYKVIFDSGDQMGAPAETQLTAGSVAPGGTVDVSVNMKAPASAGTYQGNYRIKSGDNVVFGVGAGNVAFYVRIKAISGSPTPTATNPALPPAIAQVVLTQVNSEGGSVRTGGDVRPGLYNTGDTEDNKNSQVFASYDISGIPASATIVSVKFDFAGYDKLGDPWGDMGCLRIYEQNYGSLDAGDYFGGTALGAIVRWCNDGELSSTAADEDMKNFVQGKLGSSRMQFRFQFKDKVSNGDGNADMVRFGPMRIIVVYQ